MLREKSRIWETLNFLTNQQPTNKSTQKAILLKKILSHQKYLYHKKYFLDATF